MNPKFRQFPCDVSGETSTSNEFENSTSNVSNENKKKRDSRTSNNETTYPHHEFLKAMIEQQKFLQQQELEQQQVRFYLRVFHLEFLSFRNKNENVKKSLF